MVISLKFVANDPFGNKSTGVQVMVCLWTLPLVTQFADEYMRHRTLMVFTPPRYKLWSNPHCGRWWLGAIDMFFQSNQSDTELLNALDSRYWTQCEKQEN